MLAITSDELQASEGGAQATTKWCEDGPSIQDLKNDVGERQLGLQRAQLVLLTPSVTKISIRTKPFSTY